MAQDSTMPASDGRPYRKVGGWLLVYVILTGVSSLLSTISSIVDLMKEDSPGPTAVIDLVLALVWVLPIVWILQLDWRGIRLARGLEALGILYALALAVYYLMSPSEADALTHVIGFVIFAASGALWLWYLLVSRRVNRDTAWHHRDLAATDHN